MRFIMQTEEPQTLPQTVVELLIRKGYTLATAESCTGGLIAKKITDIAGASACFHCGMVTYSNDQKERILGVRSETLRQHGAVSEETALEMSKGAKERSGSVIGIGVTGIAGPDGGTAEKPVGLVYISICTDAVHRAYRLQLHGTREEVREQAALSVLEMIRQTIDA